MFKNFKKLTTLTLFVGFLTACAPTQTTHPLHSTANPDCIGQIGPIPAGLMVAQNKELLDNALGEKGKGKLCQGQVYEAVEAVKVYRVWDSSKSWSAKGSWWSFNAPGDSKREYQVENDICPEWSNLDRAHSCMIIPGKQLVVGTGQSAQCDKEFLKQSATNQVFINNDTRNNVYLVDNCTDSVPWPAE
ncbi:hypothetical protein RYZ26_10705 [Terasakiella sp. A23]|uniref:hypothetical protein n=1 Tax=Terasakiella sp. FCG-A23 TaxID=3080561 RepID=UPI002953CFC3|nr:hypothetical protein [Terasakiella sp. A23]MDV7340064.1 hypothetical protein [Terasakiella sp. A23]